MPLAACFSLRHSHPASRQLRLCGNGSQCSDPSGQLGEVLGLAAVLDLASGEQLKAHLPRDLLRGAVLTPALGGRSHGSDKPGVRRGQRLPLRAAVARNRAATFDHGGGPRGGVHDAACSRSESQRASWTSGCPPATRTSRGNMAVSPLPCLLYTSRAHETRHDLVCRLLLEKKKKK